MLVGTGRCKEYLLEALPHSLILETCTPHTHMLENSIPCAMAECSTPEHPASMLHILAFATMSFSVRAFLTLCSNAVEKGLSFFLISLCLIQLIPSISSPKWHRSQIAQCINRRSWVCLCTVCIGMNCSVLRQTAALLDILMAHYCCGFQ